MTFLLSLLGFARKALSAAFALVVRYPVHAALVAALVLAGWLWIDRGNVRAERDAAVKGRADDRKAYTAAQAEAERVQRAANLAISARYRATAEKTDDNYRIALSDAQRAAAGYAATHGLRSQAACRAPGSGPSPSVSGDPARGDGPGEDAVVVSRRDFDTLNENTARLAAVREWALDLIAAGLAVGD